MSECRLKGLITIHANQQCTAQKYSISKEKHILSFEMMKPDYVWDFHQNYVVHS